MNNFTNIDIPQLVEYSAQKVAKAFDKGYELGKTYGETAGRTATLEAMLDMLNRSDEKYFETENMKSFIKILLRKN